MKIYLSLRITSYGGSEVLGAYKTLASAISRCLSEPTRSYSSWRPDTQKAYCWTNNHGIVVRVDEKDLQD